MSYYRFPHPSDDLKSELMCTVAAEFIHRLDAFLEYRHESSEDGDVPIEVVGTVKHCCEAALDLLLWAATQPDARCDVPKPKWVPSNDAFAVKMIGDAADVLTSLLESQASAPTAICPGLLKGQLMSTLAGEFFLRFGALAERVITAAHDTVDTFDMEMLRGCLDGAMGMVYELDTAVWTAGHAVPARAILAVHDHVISHRLECAGPEAMQLIEEVYDAVVELVMSET